MTMPPEHARHAGPRAARGCAEAAPPAPRRGSPLRRAAWLALLLCAACGPGAPAPLLDLPERPGDAPGGTEVVRALRNLDVDAREERIYAEIARGNVPAWLRRLRPVEMEGEIDGRERSVTFWVTPDYLAVGADDDYLLVPLSPRTAQRVADLAGASLPTPGMVDAVWMSARARLAPIRIPPDSLLATLPYLVRHDRLVHSQRGLLKAPPGVFVAGHKVDLVLAPGAPAGAPGGVALYGWHRTDGQPIQPLHTDLEEGWVTYNLGVRLVDRDVLVDGSERELLEVLRDPGLAALLNGGG